MSSRCLGAACGLLVDRAVGEPPASVHPVARFGAAMQSVEQRVYADRRGAGLVYAALGMGLGAIGGSALRSTSAAVATTTAGRMLRGEAAGVRDALVGCDIEGARRRLPALVGRDATELDASGIAAATIESLAENLVDAVVAPALWAVAFGAMGAGAYRAANTMDAMVGHHSARYERFGWASARVDDIAGYVPARVMALLVCLARPGRAREVFAAVREDAGAHPSPNAGVAEAAFAGALGLELGGTVRYGDAVEHRPTLGSGPRPTPHDIERAIRLADRVELVLAGVLVASGLLARRRPR